MRAKHWSPTQLSYNKDMDQCITVRECHKNLLTKEIDWEHENKENEKKKLYKTFFGISFNFSNEDYGKRW